MTSRLQKSKESNTGSGQNNGDVLTPFTQNKTTNKSLNDNQQANLILINVPFCCYSYYSVNNCWYT